MFRRFKIRNYEIGIRFHDGEYRGMLAPGVHWLFDPLRRIRVDVASLRDPWLVHEKLDLIVKSGDLADRANVLDLKDHERALVWIDGRFSQVLPPGLYAHWRGFRDVRLEVVDARTVRFEHAQLKTICRSPTAKSLLDVCTVQRDHAGVLFVDGAYVDTLRPGEYVFWKNVGEARVVEIDCRETTLDVAGQEIMTADKVTLRLNAAATYRVADPRLAVCHAVDARQSLYRETQLALRATIGSRELDAILADREGLIRELEDAVARRASQLGLEIISIGIRDVILPGEMKELLNKVTEARKAAEANLIVRREETAAMRSQANTARLLAENPVLMRLRELESLERIAGAGKLSVVLGEKGLADRVVNIL